MPENGLAGNGLNWLEFLELDRNSWKWSALLDMATNGKNGV